MLINDIHSTILNSPNADMRARVELYKGSTLEKICNCGKELSEFTIERTGEGKFFGFGICQKLKASFLDENIALNITKEHTLEATFGVESNFIYPFPNFYVEDIVRDEETGDITVTAYDILYRTANHTVSELQLPDSYNLLFLATACASLLGISLKFESITNTDAFLVDYEPNFDGTETLRDVLNAIAEATQTIYYINNHWELTFKRLDKSQEPVYTINRNNYMGLTTDGARTLGKVVHATVLDDNVRSDEPSTMVEGVTQYVRDNPFWDLRDDIGALVDNAQAIVGGLSIDQCECEWFGNYLLEIGDKINIVAKGGKTLTTYLLDDSLTYDGAITQITKWEYNESDEETAANPSSLGDALKQTYARVDKANKRINLVVSDVASHGETLTQLNLTTEGISANVKMVEEQLDNSVDDINESIGILTKEVETKMTSEQVNYSIKQTLDAGLDKVAIKSTDFVFDSTGLTVSKTNEPTSTNLNPNGLTIYKDAIQKVKNEETGEEVITNEKLLDVNKDGVNAENLHATTYLKIGGRTRFENYESNRIGCFWIGGID